MSRPDSSRGPGGVQVRLDAPRPGGRRRRVVLAVSLAANVALGWLIAARLGSGAGAPAPAAMSSSVQPARPAWAARPPATPEADEPPPGAMRLDVYEAFAWTMLPAADLAALRDALRERECPERLVRVILRGILKRELDARVEVLLRPVLDNFWGWLDLNDTKKVGALGNAIEAVEDETQERYEALIAGVAEPEERTEEQSDPRYAFLPEEKQAAVLELQRQFDERRRALRQAGVGQTKEQSAAWEAEHEASRDALLTEEEREELRLRLSGRADQLRHLQEIELTPAELRDIAATRDAFEGRRETEGESLRDQARNEFMEKLQAEREAALRQRLGEERFAELGRAEDGDYQTTMEVTRRLGLPEATGRELFELAKSLNAARGERPESAERDAEILRTAEREVPRILRNDAHAVATYRRHQLEWLRELAKPEHPDPYDRDW